MKEQKKNEELQSRRDFFRNAAKAALPIFAATVMFSNPIIAKTIETPMDCNYGCSGSCYGSCSGSCASGCLGGCSASACRVDCTYSCSGGCERTCTGSCMASCMGTCAGSNMY